MRYAYPYPYVYAYADRIGFPVISQIGDAASALGDVISDAFDAIPGSDWIKKAINSGTSWIGDFAKTPTGFFVLQVITNNLYGPLASVGIPVASGMVTIGPQVASILFAAPGVLAGQDFTTAYVKSMSERIVGLVQYFAATAGEHGVSDALQSVTDGFSKEVTGALNDVGFQKALSDISSDLTRSGARQALRDAHLTPTDVAKALKIRPDAAATAINAHFPKNPPYAAGYPAEGESEFGPDGQPNQTYKNAEQNSGANLDDILVAVQNASSGAFADARASGNPTIPLEQINVKRTGAQPGQNGFSPIVQAGLRKNLADALARGDQASAQAAAKTLAIHGWTLNDAASKNPYALNIVPSSPHGLMYNLAVAAALTSPLWLTYLFQRK